ncbi:hypothetical protein SAMN05446934_2792 [Paraburkholderia hospita]|nr:hypothetical protein SAMN05446934_2792 [Paraburkholderia hospita]
MKDIHAAITTATSSIATFFLHKSKRFGGRVIADASNNQSRGRSPMSISSAIPNRFFS